MLHPPPVYIKIIKTAYKARKKFLVDMRDDARCRRGVEKHLTL